MKKLIPLFLTFTCLAFSTSLQAQSEIPKKNKPVTRPQTGGPEGGDGSMSGRNQSDNRPVYRPRVIHPQPYMYPYPIYQNYPDNGDNNTVSEAEIKRIMAARKRAAAEVELKKALYEFKSPEQAFDISDVSKAFDIVGEKGFRVSFPELAFVDDEGNPVLGEVEIHLTEYTDFSEMAEAGLTTMTTDGSLLETGGMINLEAMSGEKKLKLASGKTVDITVPSLKDKSGFQTFYGVGSDVVTWSVNPQQNNESSDDKKFDGYTIKMLKSTQSVAGKQVSLVIFRNWKPLEDYVNENLKVSDAVRSKIMKDGIPFLYTIEFNMMGKVKEVRAKYPEYAKNSLIAELQGKIKSILLDAPPVTLNEGNLESGRTYDIMFATAKNYIEPGPFNVVISSPLDPKGENKAGASETNANPNSENVDEFVMGSSELSKINCDRFSGSGSKDTQTFHFERADAKVYVVFKDQRSFIQPTGANGHYILTKVPSGSNVRYVAVVYGDDGSIRMGVKESSTTTETVNFGELGEFSAEGLKKVLNER